MELEVEGGGAGRESKDLKHRKLRERDERVMIEGVWEEERGRQSTSCGTAPAPRDALRRIRDTPLSLLSRCCCFCYGGKRQKLLKISPQHSVASWIFPLSRRARKVREMEKERERKRVTRRVIALTALDKRDFHWGASLICLVAPPCDLLN